MKEKVEFDLSCLKEGEKYIVGVDEVGRGPLAGPVVCCAVIMPLSEEDIIDGVDDSKKVSEKKRLLLDEKIREKAISYCICEVSSKEIDEMNILSATKYCMKKCVEGLSVKPDAVIIDAVDIDVNYRKVITVKGDLKSYSVGAASIVAKVYRDNLMVEYSKIYPQYAFEKNKGYGTKEHINAIKEIGTCPIHRKTFVKNFSVKKENEQLSLL